jgi:hypothetical protein
MSYNVSLWANEEIVELPEKYAEGGTYVLGGSNKADLNITYNYSGMYRDVFGEGGMNVFDGMNAGESIALLEQAVSKLGTKRYDGRNWQFSFNAPRAIWKTFQKYDWDNPENRAIMDGFIRAGWLYDGGAYWKATPGNAGHALSILLEWAKIAPHGVWRVGP